MGTPLSILVSRSIRRALAIADVGSLGGPCAVVPNHNKRVTLHENIANPIQSQSSIYICWLFVSTRVLIQRHRTVTASSCTVYVRKFLFHPPTTNTPRLAFEAQRPQTYTLGPQTKKPQNSPRLNYGPHWTDLFSAQLIYLGIVAGDIDGLGIDAKMHQIHRRVCRVEYVFKPWHGPWVLRVHDNKGSPGLVVSGYIHLSRQGGISNYDTKKKKRISVNCGKLYKIIL